MTANLCVESTARHATEHGYRVTFLSDAIDAASLPAYEASIHVNFPLIGNAILEVDEFLAALTGGGGAIAVGDTVVGSDRGEIGEVEKVVQPEGGAPGHLVVPRGLVFEKETYIPLDAVTARIGNRVHINIPTLVVGKMPWSEPPTADATAEKAGPPAASVTHLYGSVGPTSGEPKG